MKLFTELSSEGQYHATSKYGRSVYVPAYIKNLEAQLKFIREEMQDWIFDEQINHINSKGERIK